jgi:uncharacterized membrane protein SirB2
MNPVYYQILHVFALLVLTAQTFAAFANPAPESRRQTLMITGIASLLLIVSGFGLVAKLYGNHIQAWMVVKIVCWLIFSALAGVAYRKPQLRRTLSVIGFSVLLIALVMAFAKPQF